MKRFIRIFVVEGVVLYFVSYITTGLIFKNGASSILMTALALGVASLFIKPIINLLLLPLNLLTFGVFRFLTNAITLYLVDLVLIEFTVGNFFFKGYKGELVVLPSFGLSNDIFSYLAFSFLISLTTTVIYWLLN